MLRVHRIPFSTNVERIALAAGHKGVPIAWVDHDPADRSAIEALSGQRFFPVAELEGGEVVHDSPVILRRLEALAPDPPLWPADPAGRARADVFAEWFNLVWKRPPNRIADGAAEPGDAAWLANSRDVFEGLLHDGDFLLGTTFTVADVLAFPFLKYGRGVEPGDEDPFHHVLAEHLALAAHPRLAAWIARVDALPRS